MTEVLQCCGEHLHVAWMYVHTRSTQGEPKHHNSKELSFTRSPLTE